VSGLPAAGDDGSAARSKKSNDARARGRRQRESLPMGVILWDKVKIYSKSSGWKKLYRVQTGDIVRVYNDVPESGRHRIHPGVDVYLAETSKNIEAAGNRLPDKDGWIDKEVIHIFSPKEAVAFTQSVEAVTLGQDTTFSTLDFYDRAMKNPDLVVHSIFGPKLIFFVSLHDEYSSSWTRLYRDEDSKIRSLALAGLKQRGVGGSRIIIEDLIGRLAELTKKKASGESEAEVLAILNILKESGHPRVPAALAGFQESWRESQSDKITGLMDSIMGQEPASASK